MLLSPSFFFIKKKSIKALLNTGLTVAERVLKNYFPSIVPVELPIVENASNKPLDPN